jgi:hypothetical protein
MTDQPTVPQAGFYRLKQILGDRKAEPPIPALIPISRTAWYKGIKAGRYPPPLKLSPKVSVWRVEDINSLIENP